MTTINFRSKWRAGHCRRAIRATGSPLLGPCVAMAAPAVRRPTRDPGAANGAEDRPVLSSARFHECGQLRHRAVSEFPGLRLLSPANEPAPRSADPAIPTAFLVPVRALDLAAGAASTPL